MIFISQEGDLINSKPSDPYFEKVKLFILKWQNGISELEVKTSGSTGKPKKIKLSREKIQASVAQTKEAFSLDEDHLLLCNLSVDFIAGKLMIIRALELKSELIVIRPEGNILDSIRNFGYMLEQKRGKLFLAFVPLQITKVLEEPAGHNLLNMAKAVLIGGAKVNKHLAKLLTEIHSPVYATFGMTETVTHFAIKQINATEPQEYFKPLKGTALKVDEEGCLSVKNACTDNLWLKTNDRVELRMDQSFKPLGRADNVINSGGIKIHLEEIEAQIDQLIDFKHPFFCAGVNDTLLGQKLVLFIESEEKDLEILAKLKSEMAKFAAPKEVLFIKEFARTTSGKIDKIKTINASAISN